MQFTPQKKTDAFLEIFHYLGPKSKSLHKVFVLVSIHFHFYRLGVIWVGRSLLHGALGVNDSSIELSTW